MAMKSAVTKAVLKAQAEAMDIDNRRRLQITNQVAAINRLLADGSYDKEMERLHTELAETQARLVDAMIEVNRLQDLQAAPAPEEVVAE